MPLSFKSALTAYMAGRRVNAEEWNAFTKVLGGSSNLGFGVPVMPGASDGLAIELDATNGRNVLGITEASVVLPHPGDYFVPGENLAVCESGVIGVLLGADVTAGAQARWNTANKTWTGAAQSATVVTIPGAQFEEAGTNGSVGVVRYRRPVPSVSVSG